MTGWIAGWRGIAMFWSKRLDWSNSSKLRWWPSWQKANKTPASVLKNTSVLSILHIVPLWCRWLASMSCSLFGSPSSSVVGWGSLVLLWRNRWRWVSMARCRQQVCVLVMLASKPILLGRLDGETNKVQTSCYMFEKKGKHMVYIELGTLNQWCLSLVSWNNSMFGWTSKGWIWCCFFPEDFEAMDQPHSGESYLNPTKGKRCAGEGRYI